MYKLNNGEKMSVSACLKYLREGGSCADDLLSELGFFKNFKIENIDNFWNDMIVNYKITSEKSLKLWLKTHFYK